MRAGQPRVYLEWLPALAVLPEPQVSFRESRPNYFYEMMIMACNHDIAYLVRSACNANARVHAGDARATPVQPTRVYFGTQQIHARRETRARLIPIR